MIWIPII